jgi:hypothetical protein
VTVTARGELLPPPGEPMLPCSPPPQQKTTPAWIAHVLRQPLETWVTLLVNPATWTGTVLSLFVPSPR